MQISTKMVMIVAIALAVGIVFYFVFKRGKAAPDEKFFVTTSGQSEERIKKLNLDAPSENAFYILDTTKLSIPKEGMDFKYVEYKPDPATTWIIDINRPGAGIFNKEDLWKIFDKEWRTKFEAAEIFGRSATDGKWTYVIAGDSPENYDSVQVAISLLEVYDEKEIGYRPEKLESYVIELAKRLEAYPIKLTLHKNEDVTKAVEKAKKLGEIKQAFDHDFVIILKADSNYTGLSAWDALGSIGLRWGDGDLFHWDNNSDYGDQDFFTVWSTTPPGYFLPEEIKRGAYNPQDLLFGYSVARSADPVNIFDRMVEGVKYCQKRLGGEILNQQGQAFNESEEKKQLVQFVEKMKRKGILPGSSQAMRMF